MAKNAYDKLSWDKKEEIIKRKSEAKLKKVVEIEDLKIYNVNINDDLEYLNENKARILRNVRQKFIEQEEIKELNNKQIFVKN